MAPGSRPLGCQDLRDLALVIQAFREHLWKSMSHVTTEGEHAPYPASYLGKGGNAQTRTENVALTGDAPVKISCFCFQGVVGILRLPW